MTTYQPYLFHGQERRSDLLILCDHASNLVPKAVNNGSLGLPGKDMDRHIAYDIGAKGVSAYLADMLDAPVIFSNFSRLVVDPNRGEDDPTLIMQLYDGSLIPANRMINEPSTQKRLNAYYRPYHDAIGTHISGREKPVLISIHSFAPKLNGSKIRPWHVGVLHGDDQRLSGPVLEGLRALSNIVVGDNQPYSGHLPGDTMDRHGIKHGHLHILIELRNDLITNAEQQKNWANRLAPILRSALA